MADITSHSPSPSPSLHSNLSHTALEDLFAPSEISQTFTDDGSSLEHSFDDLLARRQRSTLKFYSTLDEICEKYVGDGDEEADDVMDLDNMQIVSLRGGLQRRSDNAPHQFNRSRSHPTRFPSRPPPSTTETNIAQDIKASHSNPPSPGTQDSGDASQWTDDDDDSIASTSSVVPLEPLPARPSKPAPIASSCSPLPLLSTLDQSLSPPAQPMFPLQYPPTTNTLFERLKKRVQERSFDLQRHHTRKKGLNEDHLASQSSSRPKLGNSSMSSLCRSITTTSDVATDRSSETQSHCSKSIPSSAPPSALSSRASYSSSPITPRYTHIHPPSCDNLGSEPSFPRPPSNKRRRLMLNQSSPAAHCSGRKPNAISRLKHELGTHKASQDSPRHHPHLKAGPPTLPDQATTPTNRALISRRPKIPSEARLGTQIHPSPLRPQSSRESSEDPLCLPSSPWKKTAKKTKETLERDVNQCESINAIETCSDDGPLMKDVKESLSGFAFSSSPCRQVPRKRGWREV